MNKCLNFKSGSGLSTLLINRTIEDEGGVLFTNVDRHHATVGYSVVPDRATGLIPLLATDCSYEKWDVRDAASVAQCETGVANESAQVILTESLYAAAFGPQSSAGRPLYTTGTPLDQVKEFRSRAYGINGAILTATGVQDHKAFCSQVENLVSDCPKGSADAISASTYTGGETRISSPFSGYAHVALGFQAPASSAVANVVKHLFSISGAEAGVSGFATTDILGVYAGSDAPETLIDAMTGTLKASISADTLNRAKALAKAEAMFALDGGSKSLAASMTASVVEGATFSNSTDVASRYDAVSEADVKNAIATMIKSNLSLAAVGDINSVPYHATVANNLK